MKIRLPHYMHLPGSGWQVRLTSISLPDSKVYISQQDENITDTSWYKYFRQQGEGGMIEKQVNCLCVVNDLKDLDSIMDGVHFIKAVIYSMEKRLEVEEDLVQGR